MRQRIVGLALVVVALGSSGCAEREYRCGAGPTEPITAFIVTIVTGDDGTDMNINFCYRRHSGGGDSCTLLDSPANDFESHSTGTYQINLTTPIAVGDFDRFWIHNSGGGFFELAWEIASIKLDVNLQSGARMRLYEESDIDDTLYSDESYDPVVCGY